MTARPLQLALLLDLREEGWPSMDLVGEMLAASLARHPACRFAVSVLRPPMRRRATRRRAGGWLASSADRFLNRFFDYPRFLRGCRSGFDLFHIVDHSYAHLAHSLPARRTLVTCHDLDAFRSLLEPRVERRSLPFRLMAKRVLNGLRKAARVICDSGAVSDELTARCIVPKERLSIVPLGVHPDFTAAGHPAVDPQLDRLLGPPGTTIDILHVGSTAPRKRIDSLLKIFAAIRAQTPAARLVRVGGLLTPEQAALAATLGLEGALVSLPVIERSTLASVYRRAAVVLLPSEREGFGLPVIEAMACGTPVVAADLPALREVGGGAAVYRPVNDVEAWRDAVVRLLQEREQHPRAWEARQAAGRARASRFTWEACAARMMDVYPEVAGV